MGYDHCFRVASIRGRWFLDPDLESVSLILDA